MKEEHRNNYKDLNLLNGNKVKVRKQWLFRQEMELKKINMIKM
jgi:hypothetical protein